MKEASTGSRCPPTSGSSTLGVLVEEPGGNRSFHVHPTLLLPQQSAMNSLCASAAELMGLSSTML